LGPPPVYSVCLKRRSFRQRIFRRHRINLYAGFTESANLKGSYLWAKAASLREIDCLDNKFTIDYCVAARTAVDRISYQIKLSYNDDKLTVEFTDIEPLGFIVRSPLSSSDMDYLPKFDPQRMAEQVKVLIEQSLANANVYNSAKKAFMENNSFLYWIFSDITSVLMDEYAATIFKGEIGLSVSILDVKKNENAEFKNYAAVISAGLYTTETRTSSAFAFVTLYTNDSSLARLKSGEKLTLSGQFVRMESGTTAPYIIMTK